MPDHAEPTPLAFEPILKAKVWGGTRLREFGRAVPAGLPPGHGIGESWEIADLAATAASGGGGGAARSAIADGPLAGQTIADAVALWGRDLLGPAASGGDGAFPLLVKYLDAREHLSVQVHPSPAYAASNAGAHIKTEAWVVVRADPAPDGSPPVIFSGLRPGVTRGRLEDAVRRGTVVELLNAVPAVVGACHTLPSGTIHALGAGVLVAEIQTPSDTTFRVYDWVREYGRPQRELHVEAALACIDPGAPPDVVHGPGRVSSTDFFTIDAVRGHCESVAIGRVLDGRCGVLMVTATAGAGLASESGAFDERPLVAGSTVLIPASLSRDAVLRAGPGTEAVLAGVV